MRKYTAFILAFFMTLLFTGCNSFLSAEDSLPPASETLSHESEDSVDNITFKEPPDLTVIYNSDSFTAFKGTYSWSYSNGDGTEGGIENDSAHPLEAKEYMQPITMTSETLTAYLRWEVTPDKVTVRCWSEKHWNDIYIKGVDVPVDIAGTDFVLGEDSEFAGLHTLQLEKGEYIYEVIAAWNSHPDFHGVAHYGFFTFKQ